MKAALGMHEAHRVEARLGGGVLTLETGVIAQLTDGSVVARQGDVVVLATVAASPEASTDRGSFPLTVEYREKLAAAGRIPGGYLRRESRSTERETLAARFIDRSIRPLFREGFQHDTQVSVTVMSYEPDPDTSVLGINAAAAALLCSGLPWDGPVAAVRVVRRGEELIAAPGAAERVGAALDMVAAFTRHGLVMAEGHMDQEPEEGFLRALEFARSAVDPLLEASDQLRTAVGLKAGPYPAVTVGDDIVTAVEAQLLPLIAPLADIRSKRRRHMLVKRAQVQTMATVEGIAPAGALAQAVEIALRRRLRAETLRGVRLDGRRRDEVRPIAVTTGWLPRAHGSAVFTRGETQAVVTCTLGSGRDELEMETLDGPVRRRFMVHYNFPSYSVGEVRPSRGPGRRELGHGNLVRAALEPVLPESAVFPFIVRVESEITQSDGSSSMASVCGGSLALMDAGVPIKAAVAGVAMGLVMEGGEHAILTDISEDEDHAGDMDFKVAGTSVGMTAVQLDNKLGAVPIALLANALSQARRARLRILDAMNAVCDRPRLRVDGRVPRVESIRIRPNRIRELIGPSGKTIKELQSTTGTRIEVGRDGTVHVWANGEKGQAQALERIQVLGGLAQVDHTYQGTALTATEHGAYIRLFGSIEGFLPAADGGPMPSPGTQMRVRVVGVDRRGRIELTSAETESQPAGGVASPVCTEGQR